MEIPILLGASPKIANPSVLVPIRFDRWRVRTENLVDSELVLCSDLQSPFREDILNGRIYGPCQVRIEFKKRGMEKAVSVYAEECHD